MLASTDKTPFLVAVELATRYPGVELSTSYGTPALKVDGKVLARLRSEAEGWLVTRCDMLEREMLLSAAPHVFHLTEHYVNYPMVLIDLAQIHREALADILEKAWRHSASAARIREHETRLTQ